MHLGGSKSLSGPHSFIIIHFLVHLRYLIALKSIHEVGANKTLILSILLKDMLGPLGL